MAIVAYSPVARGRIRGDETLTAIGQAHGKTAAQVCLRWLVQQNIAAIPRTSKIERLSENIEIFDFVLSDDEMAPDLRDGQCQGPADRLRLLAEMGLRRLRTAGIPGNAHPATMKTGFATGTGAGYKAGLG